MSVDISTDISVDALADISVDMLTDTGISTEGCTNYTRSEKGGIHTK